jgi:pimeloyl-ACP methyl ester carboxylesterase
MVSAMRASWLPVPLADPATNAALQLPELVRGARVAFRVPDAGLVTEYQGGRPGRPPVVLVHSLRLGASAAEVRPLFEGLAHDHPVVAVDLPGFGRSERNPVRRDRDLYTEVLAEVLERALVRYGSAPHVVALDRSCELAAAAALQLPRGIASSTMISPTGFGAPAEAAQRGTWRSLPAVGRAMFALRRSRRAIHRQLAACFVGPVDRRLEDAAVACAAHPDARDPSWVDVDREVADESVRDRTYERLACPVLVVHDRAPAGLGFEELARFVAKRPAWRVARIRPSLGMPHFERPAVTLAAVSGLLAQVEEAREK